MHFLMYNINVRQCHYSCFSVSTFLCDWDRPFLRGQQHSLAHNDHVFRRQEDQIDLWRTTALSDTPLEETWLFLVVFVCTFSDFGSSSMGLIKVTEFFTSFVLRNCFSYRISCRRKPRLGSAQRLRSIKYS